jgi:hypothetical protein
MRCTCSSILWAMLLCPALSFAQADSLSAAAPNSLDSLPFPAISISFVGSGDFQKALIGGTDVQANSGLGLIFRRLWEPNQALEELEVDISINIAYSADSMSWNLLQDPLKSRRQIGGYLLSPANASQSASFGLRLYWSKPSKKWWSNLLSGIQMQVNTSNRVLDFEGEAINFSGMAGRVGVFHDFMPSAIRREKGYSITVGAHYAYRGMMGDLASLDRGLLRYQLLGTARTHYHGLEITFGFKLQNIRAEVQIPIFPAPNNPLSGLTDSQMITRIGFVGGFPIAIEQHRR